MLARILNTFLYRFQNRDEALKFIILAAAAFFVTGAQWPIKSLKDSLLIGEIGADSQPLMRIASVFMCFFISLIYGQMVNIFRREVVLYIIVGFLTFLGLFFYVLLGLYPLGILPFAKDFVIRGFYLYADGFLVLTLPIFWAFVNDTVTPEESRRNYGFMAFFAQFGALVAVLFCLPLSKNVSNIPIISLISILFLLIFAALIFYLIRRVDRSSLRGYVSHGHKIEEKHKIPFLKGLGLLLASPYVAGILFLTAAPDILTSVVDFKFLKIVELSFLSDKAGIVNYILNYSLLIQVGSCVFAFLGGFFCDRLGVGNCIIIYPLCFLASVVLMTAFPTLLIVTGVLAFIKGLHYGLNKPAREGLYVPTTKEVKYKSKAWIEVFGSRIFKATGASVCKLSGPIVSCFLIGMPFVWVLTAFWVGKRYDKCVADNETIV